MTFKCRMCGKLARTQGDRFEVCQDCAPEGADYIEFDMRKTYTKVPHVYVEITLSLPNKTNKGFAIRDNANLAINGWLCAMHADKDRDNDFQECCSRAISYLETLDPKLNATSDIVRKQVFHALARIYGVNPLKELNEV